MAARAWMLVVAVLGLALGGTAAPTGSLGDLKTAVQVKGTTDAFELTTVNGEQIKIMFWSDSVVRLWLADPTNGNWSDPASEDIVIGKPHGVEVGPLPPLLLWLASSQCERLICMCPALLELYVYCIVYGWQHGTTTEIDHNHPPC
jgi:hypothetical protein